MRSRHLWWLVGKCGAAIYGGLKHDSSGKRGLGATAIGAVARAIYEIKQDDDEPCRRYLRIIKSNDGLPSMPLAGYVPEKRTENGFFLWEEYVRP